VSPIVVADVYAGLFYRPIGESGIVFMIAPFPCSDSIELPTMFIAVIFAKIPSPQGMLYGAAFKTEIGTIHYRLVTMDRFKPLQLIIS